MSGLLRRFLFHFCLIIFLAGCGKLDPEQQNKNNGAETLKLRFGHDMPETSAHHMGALHFAALVHERSRGRLKIEIYPSHRLGNDHEMMAMAQSGTLDIIMPPTAKLSVFDPAMQVLDIPFLFSTYEEAHHVLDSELGQALMRRLDQHGLVGLGFWESGFKQFTSNRPITSIDDFKGQRFRIMRSKILRDQFDLWGANSLAIDFTKTYQALSENIVDGQENPIGTVYDMNFHEVQKFLTISNHGYIAEVLCISKQTFERLPADLQEVIITSAMDATKYQRQQVSLKEEHYRREIKKSSIKISTLQPHIKSELKDRSLQIIEQNRYLIGSDIIELALQALQEKKPYADDELVIGLDADMAGNSALSGLAIKRGIEIALHEINSHGGVLGKKLRLVTRDNSMVSARGIKNIEFMSTIPNLVAIFGGISSPVTISELPIVHEKKILFLDPWAAATEIIDNNFQPNYVFRLSVRDADAAPFLVNEALLRSKKIALLLVNNDWGRSNYRALKYEFSKRHLKPAYVQWFDWGGSAHTDLIKKIYSSDAEVIVYVGNVIEAASFIDALAGMEKSMPVVSHWGITGGRFVKLAGDALNKVDVFVLQTFSFINNITSKAKQVLALYKKLYGIKSASDIVAPTGTAHAYDMTHILARAIRKAGSSDMSKIRKAMENLAPYHGLVRYYEQPFSEKRHEALNRDSFFMAVYQNGKLIPYKNKQP